MREVCIGTLGTVGESVISKHYQKAKAEIEKGGGPEAIDEAINQIARASSILRADHDGDASRAAESCPLAPTTAALLALAAVTLVAWFSTALGPLPAWLPLLAAIVLGVLAWRGRTAGRSPAGSRTRSPASRWRWPTACPRSSIPGAG